MCIRDSPRTDEGREWEDILPVRQWLYQTPEQILIKASNGAYDFGNKFGQPLICGSVPVSYTHLTTQHEVIGEPFYDKLLDFAMEFFADEWEIGRASCRERV